MVPGVRLIPSLVILLLLVGLTTGCGGTTKGTNEKPAVGKDAGSENAKKEEDDSLHKVFIRGNAFIPQDLTVSVGQTVRWTNRDGVSHTVTENNGVFKSGTIPDTEQFEQVFNTPGAFAYHCEFHPTMVATVTVIPESESETTTQE